MTNMELYDVIIIFLLILVIIVNLALFYKRQLKSPFTKDQNNLKNSSSEFLPIVIPNKINAYERMVLFLERISPNHLVPRLNDSQYSAKEFQFILTNEIAQEFEHNLTQQLYIPSKTWQMILIAKDQVIQDIIQTTQSLPPNATSKDLALAILNQSMTSKHNLPTKEAIELLKKEFNELN